MNTVATTNPITRANQILEIVSQNRSITYRLLALSFTFPDDTLLDMLRSGEFIRELHNATAWLGEDQKELFDTFTALEAYSEISLVSLQSEYSRLFIEGISRISPRENAYRWKDACHISQSDSDLQQTLQHQYNSFGVHCDLGSEDHISVELEYMAFLCDQEFTSWSHGFSKAARDLRSQERSFVDDHFGRWLPEFCHRVHKHASQSFYFFMADFCDRWFGLDHGSGYISIRDFQ